MQMTTTEKSKKKTYSNKVKKKRALRLSYGAVR